MDAADAKRLREPFDPKLIGKLPRKTKEGKQIYLDFVGHAAATDRLLSVDPSFTWEPMGVDEHGNPMIVSGIGDLNEPVGLWIRLTVCGVTKPGFGCGKSAKEAISDAIRNAAMRFGVALDLWAKEDLHAANGSVGGPDVGVQPAVAPVETRPASASPTDELATDEQTAEINHLIRELAGLRGVPLHEVRDALASDGYVVEGMTAKAAKTLLGKLQRWQKNLAAEKVTA